MTTIQNCHTSHSDDTNSIYSMRMTEFLTNIENNLTVQRPRCSISPINFDIETHLQQLPINQHATPQHTFVDIQSPTVYLQPLNLQPTVYPKQVPVHIVQQKNEFPTQSTPAKSNKKRVNFHSIIDLAQSSTDLSSSSFQNHTDSGYVTNSFNDQHNTPKINSTNLMSQLQALSNSLHDKENIYGCEFRTYDNKRKPRTTITRQHRDVLENAYMINKYPETKEVEYLCNLLGFEDNVIRIWFQNKRARDKLRKKSYVKNQ